MMKKVEGGWSVPYTVIVEDGSTGHQSMVRKEAFVSDARMQDAIDHLRKDTLWSRFKRRVGLK